MIDKKELRIGNWVAYGDNHGRQGELGIKG